MQQNNSIVYPQVPVQQPHMQSEQNAQPLMQHTRFEQLTPPEKREQPKMQPINSDLHQVNYSLPPNEHLPNNDLSVMNQMQQDMQKQHEGKQKRLQVIGTVFTFFFFFVPTIANILFDPNGVPWFTIAWGIGLLVLGGIWFRKRFTTKAEYRLAMHVTTYAIFNFIFFLFAVYFRYTFCVLYSLCLWGIILGLHAMKIFENGKYMNRFNVHLLIFINLSIVLLISTSHFGGIIATLASISVVLIWGLFVLFHYMKHTKKPINCCNISITVGDLENGADNSGNTVLVQNDQVQLPEQHQFQQQDLNYVPQVVTEPERLQNPQMYPQQL